MNYSFFLKKSLNSNFFSPELDALKLGALKIKLLRGAHLIIRGRNYLKLGAH